MKNLVTPLFFVILGLNIFAGHTSSEEYRSSHDVVLPLVLDLADFVDAEETKRNDGKGINYIIDVRRIPLDAPPKGPYIQDAIELVGSLHNCNNEQNEGDETDVARMS